MKRMTTTLAIAALFVASAHGQGFLNLDFESAYNLPGNPGSGIPVPVTDALPGWTVDDGDISIYYASNGFSGAGTSVEFEGGSLALSGNFSAELFDDGSISQAGLVPGNAESLQFEAEGPGAGGSLGASGFSVTLGGQTLSLSTLSDGPDYDVYGANIPAGLIGQTEPLSFICQGVGSGGVRLDNIEFSTMGVPEPAEWMLMALGGVLYGVRWRRKWRSWSEVETN